MQQPQGNMMLLHQQPQSRGMNPPAMRPPFMQSGGMQMNTAQPNQFVRASIPNAQQQAVRLQHQMVAMQQQQQQMQHNMTQQHNQHYHQSF